MILGPKMIEMYVKEWKNTDFALIANTQKVLVWLDVTFLQDVNQAF